MSDELVSQYVDRAAVTSDTDFLIKEFQRAQADFDKLNSSKKGVAPAIPPAPLVDLSSSVKQAEIASKTILTTQTATADKLSMTWREFTKERMGEYMKTENGHAGAMKRMGAEWQIYKNSATGAISTIDKAEQGSIHVHEQMGEAVQKTSAATGRAALIEAKTATEQAKAGAIRTKSLIEQEKELERLIALEAKAGGAANKIQKPGAIPDDPTNANIPFTTNLPELEAERAALQKTGTVLNEFDKAQAAAAISAAEFGEQTQITTGVQKASVIVDKDLAKAKADLIKASSAGNLQLQGYRVETQAANKATKEQALLASGLLSPYELLSKRYAASALNAKDLAVEFGHNSVQAKAAAKEALLLNTQLQTIDKTVGQSQRNVGNYAGGIQKAFSGLRTLANILPGIGLSGLFLLGFEGIQKFIGALGLFNTKLSESREATKAIREEMTVSNGEYSKAVVLVDRLKINIDLAKKGFLDKKVVLEDYNKTIGQTTGEVKTLDEAEQAITKNGENYIKMMLFKAAATKILEQAATELAKREVDSQAQQERLLSIQEARTQQQKRNPNQGGLGTASGTIDNATKLLKEFNKETDDANAKSLKVVENLLKQAALAAKDFRPPPPPGKKAAVTKESTKASLDSEFELFKIAQTRKIKLLQDESNDEKLSFEKRLSLLNDYNAARLVLIDAQLKDDLRKNDEKEAALQANLKKAKGTERNNLLIELANNENARKVLEAKANSDKLTVFDENAREIENKTLKENERLLKIQKDHFDKTIKLIEDEGFARKAQLEKDYSAGTTGLQARFDAGEISQRKFNQKRLDLDFAYGVESLQIEIDTAKKKLAVMAEVELFSGIKNKDAAKGLAELAKLERLLADASLAHFKKTEAEKVAAMQKTLNTIKEVSTQVFDFIGGMLNANAIAEKNKLQDQQDAAEKKAARDIELVNASTASEQDKAAKILIINARLQAQKDQIAQKEKQTEIAQAKFAKAVAIFNIILSTTQAVIKAYTEGDPYTKVARAILAGIAGAAQLAVAIATPIPHYFKGKNLDNYEGPATVNELRDEVIERADGSFEFPTGRNVLTYVGKNDIIHPDKDAWLNAILNAAHRDANAGMKFTPAKDNSAANLTMAMERQTKSIVSAIKGQPKIIMKGRTGYDIMFKTGSTEIIYLNQNLQ